MRQLVTLVLGLALIAAGCGDDAAATTSTTVGSTVTASSQPAPSQSSTTSQAPTETSAPAASTSTTSTTEAPTVRQPLPDDAVAAPDFDLALGEGGTFTLSAAENPVYMVFWAEW